jgi:hypothetical protein
MFSKLEFLDIFKQYPNSKVFSDNLKPAGACTLFGEQNVSESKCGGTDLGK